MSHWRSRMISLLAGFIAGLLAFFFYGLLMTLFVTKLPSRVTTGTRQRSDEVCAEGFSSPDEILSALQSADVSIRRAMYRQLFLQPGLKTSYFDYERDWNYPERAEQGRIRYPNLDESSEPEALITFVRYESPIALILKRGACGWRAVGVLSAWLRFEDYPYDGWLELVESVKSSQQEILIHDSDGDETRYVRKARLLKLVGDTLTQVAEFDEETITPLENYKGSDWASVKRRETRRAEFAPASGNVPARLTLGHTADVVKYSGSAPSHTFWRENDGAWHTARGHWRTKESVYVRALESGRETFVWDDGRKRFVRDEAQ